MTGAPLGGSNTEAPTLAVVGPGAMGGALLSGWLRSGWSPSDVVIVGRSAARVAELEEQHGVRGVPLEEAAGAGIIVLAVKPHQVDDVLAALRPRISTDAVVVCVAAGITLARLAAGLPDGQCIIRVMPNTPSLVGEGMAGVVPGAHASAEQRDLVVGLFEAVGRTIVVPESALDALTALSGSGPAYLFYVAEAMIEAGVHQGLTRGDATALVNQTIRGAGAMLADSGQSATVLRERVTSPGGTTAAALRALDDHGVRAALLAAVDACVERSHEMTG